MKEDKIIIIEFTEQELRRTAFACELAMREFKYKSPNVLKNSYVQVAEAYEKLASELDALLVDEEEDADASN